MIQEIELDGEAQNGGWHIDTIAEFLDPRNAAPNATAAAVAVHSAVGPFAERDFRSLSASTACGHRQKTGAVWVFGELAPARVIATLEAWGVQAKDRWAKNGGHMRS